MIEKLTDINSSPYSTIILDCFGTVMSIKNKKNPYRYLQEFIKTTGHIIPDYKQKIMTETLPVDNLSDFLNIDIPKGVIKHFTYLLNEEINSIELFEDTLQFLNDNKDKTIILCSNLATPYVEKAKSLLPITNFVMSCEVGYKKPQPEIYAICETYTKDAKEKIVFIGDSHANDYQSPINYGFNAVLLQRITNPHS